MLTHIDQSRGSINACCRRKYDHRKCPIIIVSSDNTTPVAETPVLPPSREGASIYDVCSGWGEEGPKKADKRNEAAWILYMTRGDQGGQKIRKFCGRHIWKPGLRGRWCWWEEGGGGGRRSRQASLLLTHSRIRDEGPRRTCWAPETTLRRSRTLRLTVLVDSLLTCRVVSTPGVGVAGVAIFAPFLESRLEWLLFKKELTLKFTQPITYSCNLALNSIFNFSHFTHISHNLFLDLTLGKESILWVVTHSKRVGVSRSHYFRDFPQR